MHKHTQPQRPAAVMFPSYEDLPLFSGTPAIVKENPYIPTARPEPPAPTRYMFDELEREYHTVYTVGYGTCTPDDLKRLVEEHSALLVDVRFSPRSRVPQWSGLRLKELVGLDNYLWLKQFGNINYKSDGPMQLMNPAAGIAALAPILRERPVILLCACRDHEDCHRSLVADVLAEALGVAVEHLQGTKK